MQVIVFGAEGWPPPFRSWVQEMRQRLILETGKEGDWNSDDIAMLQKYYYLKHNVPACAVLQKGQWIAVDYNTDAFYIGKITDVDVESGTGNAYFLKRNMGTDENGSVVRPPPVSVVLLSMHKWFVSSREFFAKVVEIYQKHKGQGGDAPINEINDDSVFDDSVSLDHVNGDQDYVKLPSIDETNESGEEFSENEKNKNGTSVPDTVVNGAINNSDHSNGSSNQGFGLGDGKRKRNSAGELVRNSISEERVIAGNNNERSQVVSTLSGPKFDVAVDESFVVAHAQPAEDVNLEIPEIRVTSVREESVLPNKPRNDSVMQDNDDNDDDVEPSVSVNSVSMNSESMSSIASDASDRENSEDQVISMWVVCQFLNFWMSTFGSDMRSSENILYDIAQFKKSLINDNKEHENRIKQLLGRSTVGSGEFSGHSSRLMRQREVARTKSLAFKDLTPKDIAEQLTHIDCKSLKKIPMTEWKIYARKTKLSDVPNLEKYVMRFNGLSRWIEAMVLNGETHEIRAHTIEKFLNVAQCLRSHQNFNSLMAVIGALNHSALRRLHQTMAVLSDSKKEFLHEMTDFLSSQGNYANYRRELGKCEGFYVPILGVHLKDLIAVDTALPDYVSEKKLINFQKMIRFYSVIATLMNFKNMQPPAPSKFELINMLRVSIQMTITEDELYELSYAREPRRASCMSTVDKTDRSNSQLFADWASGRVPSPDSQTIDKHVSSMVEAVFKFYDRDSDGLLTTDDFDAISTNFPFIDSFGVVDADRDGVVTKEEMKNYFLKANYRALGRDFIHNFQETTYLTPNFCDHCGGVLWGLIKQGFKCKDCGINCHKACKGQVVIDCRNRTLAPPSPNMNTSTLERAANKADAIRNKWRNKRKSRMVQQTEQDTTKSEEAETDEVDSLSLKLEKSDEACKVLLDENKRLKDENERLDNELIDAHHRIRQLEAQLKLVRQETITFVLEQLDALQLRRNTAV